MSSRSYLVFVILLRKLLKVFMAQYFCVLQQVQLELSDTLKNEIVLIEFFIHLMFSRILKQISFISIKHLCLN
jgi:hypothetical protein